MWSRFSQVMKYSGTYSGLVLALLLKVSSPPLRRHPLPLPADALRAQLSPLSVSRPIQTEAFHMRNFNRSFTAVSIVLMALILGACQGTTSPLVSQGAPMPALPVIQLNHSGRVYDGQAGSQC